MNQDLTQKCLSEIQNLQQQILQLQKEHDQAWETCEKWRQLYNTESQQRRADASMYQQQITALKAEFELFQHVSTYSQEGETTQIDPQINAFMSMEDLKNQLVNITQERDRLVRALKLEQENHQKTRINLTTALGDAIDSLTEWKAKVETPTFI